MGLKPIKRLVPMLCLGMHTWWLCHQFLCGRATDYAFPGRALREGQVDVHFIHEY